MSEPAAPSPVKRFCTVWAESFSGLLASLGVVSPIAEASDPISAQAPTSQEFESLVCMRFSGGGSLSGELLWVADKPAALRLSQLLMSEPPNPAAEFASTQRDAFAELLRQVAGHTATAWKTRYGNVIELVFQETVEPAPVTAQSSALRLVGEQLSELSLRLLLNEELCASLSSMPAPAPPQERRVESVSSPPTISRTGTLPANLGLVLDVELEATIRFGEREMLLRDIFGLIAGAVVELNQMVNEPAELLVAGRLVARGEVVVVDGNFGLRVTEVASVNERVAAIQL